MERVAYMKGCVRWSKSSPTTKRSNTWDHIFWFPKNITNIRSNNTQRIIRQGMSLRRFGVRRFGWGGVRFVVEGFSGVGFGRMGFGGGVRSGVTGGGVTGGWFFEAGVLAGEVGVFGGGVWGRGFNMLGLGSRWLTSQWKSLLNSWTLDWLRSVFLKDLFSRSESQELL